MRGHGTDIIDADGHILEPHDVWHRYLPPAYLP